jgi:excisionase family DNA binding protein
MATAAVSLSGEQRKSVRTCTPEETMEKIGYSVEEAVRAPGIGRTVMYEKIRNGEIASVKVGRHRIIPADALRAYFAALQAEQRRGGDAA